MLIRACVVCAAAGVSMGVAAQPQVPGGFSISNISALPDDVVPQLEAIDDPDFGQGVIAASGENGIVTFRLISPSGVISNLSTFNSGDPDISVIRVRADTGHLVDGNLQASLGRLERFAVQETTIYVTISPNGNATERFRIETDPELVAYDFVISDLPAVSSDPIVLYDLGGGSPTNTTRLATMDSQYSPVLRRVDALPQGRTDLDVVGFTVDLSGQYGGGLLIADTDTNTNDITAIYSLTDVDLGGVFVAVTAEVSTSSRRYGDIAVAPTQTFALSAYVTETLTNEIQQVAPDGTHTTWATGFVGIDSLSISPDGESMYVADLNGVWLIRPAGNEPGPAIVATDPSVPSGSTITGDPVDALRVIFTEPVSFTDSDVTITNGAGQAVAFDASGSGSQFMIIGLAAPLSGDAYTVNLADTITSAGTGQPLDGDNDGIAGGDASLTFTHRCAADQNGNGTIEPGDFTAWVVNYNAGCP